MVVVFGHKFLPIRSIEHAAFISLTFKYICSNCYCSIVYLPMVTQVIAQGGAASLGPKVRHHCLSFF